MNLNRLLKPKKICIVGASEKSGFGGDTCRNVIDYMPEGSYFLVNLKKEFVFGRRCYRSISDVPEQFDLVVICTPQSSVEELIREAALKGAGGAVVYASGYSEVGTQEGRKSQEDLIALCKELDIALMGPNCAGFVNFTDMVYPFAFLSQKRERKGSVGVISQSGQICLSLIESSNMRFSYAISAGNSAVVQMEDYMEFLVKDESTKVIAMYLEGVKNPTKFISSLKCAAKKRKPVIVLKAGRSEKGSKLAASHTGSLSGADKVFDAVFKKFGVIRVDDIEELLATSHMFSTLKEIPQKPTIASMNLSGGETGVCADVGNIWGINFPDFSQETLEKLRDQLPSYASQANPLDMTATLSYDTKGYANVLRTVMQDDNIGVVAIGYTLSEEITDPAISFMTSAIEIVAGEPNSKPMVMIPFVENTRNQEYSKRLEKVGVPILPPTVYAFKLLKYLADFVRYSPENRELTISLPEVSSASRGRKGRTEHLSKELLKDYGIPIPTEGVTDTAKEAVALANRIGYPVVLKVDSPDIMHKSDAGCVKINITDDEQVRETFQLIMDNAKAYNPDASVGGVLVQKMIDNGTEIIVGITNDFQFGPMVMCGMGGVFVEIFKDVALYPAPLNKVEAMEMLTSLKSYPLFTGYRGSSKLDVNAVAEAIVNVSCLAADHKDTMAELDINPIFVYEKGIAVADALVIDYQD